MAQPGDASGSSALQSLTLVGLAKDAPDPEVGSVLQASTGTPFLVGHVASAVPGAPAGSESSPTAVSITLDGSGAEAFSNWSAAHPRERLVALFEGRVAAIWVVNERITTGGLDVPLTPDSTTGRDLLKAAIALQTGGR